MLAAFGATPVSMPLPSVTEAIAKGVIDGFVLPWEVILSVKLQEMAKFHTETDPAMPPRARPRSTAATPSIFTVPATELAWEWRSRTLYAERLADINKRGLDFFGLYEAEKAIWFGVLVLMVVEIGMITPPVGMHVYVIDTLARDVPMAEPFLGVLPFLAADAVRVVLLVFFPILSLALVRLIE